MRRLLERAPFPASRALPTRAGRAQVKCPGCGSRNTPVIDTRPREGGIHRRRHCMDCQARFSTKEFAVTDADGKLPTWRDHWLAMLQALPDNRQRLLVQINRLLDGDIVDAADSHIDERGV